MGQAMMNIAQSAMQQLARQAAPKPPKKREANLPDGSRPNHKRVDERGTGHGKNGYLTWSKRDRELFLELVFTMSTKDLAERLGRSETAVRCHASREGISLIKRKNDDENP